MSRVSAPLAIFARNDTVGSERKSKDLSVVSDEKKSLFDK
jgi:hypothetical protein